MTRRHSFCCGNCLIEFGRHRSHFRFTEHAFDVKKASLTEKLAEIFWIVIKRE